MILPIHKPNTDPLSIKNYRPISLLSNVGKIFEKVILSKIKDHMEKEKILHPTQFGFRAQHSTTHSLTIMSDFVCTNLNRKQPTIAVALDLAKAFDTTWAEGIVYKMFSQYKFEGHICRAILNYLKDRTFIVTHRRKNSSIKEMSAGVAQGSNLGPFLFNLMMADMPQPKQDIRVLTYADDVLILGSCKYLKTAERKINIYLETLVEFFNKWKLKLNIQKCETLTIKGKKKDIYKSSRLYEPCIKIKDSNIQNKQQMRYLGVTFDQKFNFIEHMKNVIKKANSSLFGFMNNIKRKKGLSLRVKILIYKQIIRPVITYASPIWFAISSSQMEKVRRYERMILRKSTGLHWNPGTEKRYSNYCIYSKCNIQRVDAYVIENNLRFIDKLKYINNELIREYTQKIQSISYPIVDKYMSPLYIKVLEDNNIFVKDGKNLFYHRRMNTLDIEDNKVYNEDQYIPVRKNKP